MKYFALHATHGVERAVWYGLDSGPEWGQLEGTDNTLNPAGIAYRSVSGWLVGSVLTGSSVGPDGTYEVKLTTADGKQALLLWNSQQTVHLAVPGMTMGHNAQGDTWTLTDAATDVSTVPQLVTQ